MAEKLPDLHTLQLAVNKDFETLAQGVLKVPITLLELRQLLKFQSNMQPLMNAVRYKIGKFLEGRYQFQSFDNKKHFSWAKQHLQLSEDQDRRYRRHANSVDAKVAEGMDLWDAVKLPALALRGAKSKKSKEVEQNLDALRNLRGDLQDKIVTK